jgi:hypothetical protein
MPGVNSRGIVNTAILLKGDQYLHFYRSQSILLGENFANICLFYFNFLSQSWLIETISYIDVKTRYDVETMSFRWRNNVVSMSKQCRFDVETMSFQCRNNRFGVETM